MMICGPIVVVASGVAVNVIRKSRPGRGCRRRRWRRLNINVIVRCCITATSGRRRCINSCSSHVASVGGVVSMAIVVLVRFCFRIRVRALLRLRHRLRPWPRPAGPFGQQQHRASVGRRILVGLVVAVGRAALAPRLRQRHRPAPMRVQVIFTCQVDVGHSVLGTAHGRRHCELIGR